VVMYNVYKYSCECVITTTSKCIISLIASIVAVFTVSAILMI
jgi:hypothetical protein